MPRAEVGSAKHLSNKMKSKGLQRLRWYCQICEKQCRDENGFKCHTQSESHVRQMLIVGESSGKVISDFSRQFQSDFLKLLRTSHGEKKVNLNHFYQNYIANKEHVHMNATRWPSLTEFGKFLGREGICRVEEGEKGLEVSWIDNSPDALRRQDAIRKKERQDKGDEEREQRLIAEQVERARIAAEKKAVAAAATVSTTNEDTPTLQWTEGEKLKLDFGRKSTADPTNDSQEEISKETDPTTTEGSTSKATQPQSQSGATVGLKFGAGSTVKPRNVFAASKKNAAPKLKANDTRPMSEAERIMKEEMERKRPRGFNNGFESPVKKIKI